MTFYRDLSRTTMVASGKHVRAVGWLAAGHSYPQGRAPLAFLRRLERFAVLWRFSTKELWWGVFRGRHGCELCGKAKAHGNFGVPAGPLLYVAPEMVVHYVRAHRYAPPEEFITAALAAPGPGTAEYRAAVGPFRDAQARRACPEYREWKRRYPTFPGVAECLGLLRRRQTGPGLGEVVQWELYANATDHADELIEAFRSEQDAHLRFVLLSILADARLPRAVPLFAEHLRSRDKLFRHLSIEGLCDLGTAKARKVLREAGLSNGRG
jgi:hypothetical protein